MSKIQETQKKMSLVESNQRCTHTQSLSKAHKLGFTLLSFR